MPTQLDVQDVTVFRAGSPLLSDLNFSLSAGQCIALKGPNGVGKTTFLKMLCGLHTDWIGTVLWNGQETRQLPCMARMVLVGHQNALKMGWTPHQNLRQWSETVPDEHIQSALDVFQIRPLSDVPCQHLSAGQARRVTLARLLIQPADIWVLDEPGVSLDQAGRAILSQQIEAFCARGGLALVVTHGDIDLPHALELKFSLPTSDLPTSNPMSKPNRGQA